MKDSRAEAVVEVIAEGFEVDVVRVRWIWDGRNFDGWGVGGWVGWVEDEV